MTEDDYLDPILLGDCVELLRALPDASVDLVVTDPPYLCNCRSRDGRTIAGDRDSDSAWLRPAFAEIYRVLNPTASAYPSTAGTASPRIACSS